MPDSPYNLYDEFPKNNSRNLLLGNQKLLRGEILDYTIKIERQIDEYLSTHFCRDEKRKNQINELLFFTERITLDLKRQIFVNLLKQNQSNYIKTDITFLKVLEDIVPHRNIFAHLEIIDHHELSKEDGKKLVFKKYKDGSLKPKKYTIDDIVDIQANMMYLVFAMNVILQELPPLPK